MAQTMAKLRNERRLASVSTDFSSYLAPVFTPFGPSKLPQESIWQARAIKQLPWNQVLEQCGCVVWAMANSFVHRCRGQCGRLQHVHEWTLQRLRMP